MEWPKMKTAEELKGQLDRAETFFKDKVVSDEEREAALAMDEKTLKETYPKEYESYKFHLDLEAQLLHFPGMPTHVEKSQVTVLPAGARGRVFKIDISESPRVIKPVESFAEKDIADTAAHLGIGPKQFETRLNILHEEFIEGTPLLKLDPEICTPEFMRDLGQKFIKALQKLHEKNIIVNDQILTDDFGKSHMIIDKTGEVRFIDFGASVDVSDFPTISDSIVVGLMRTDPYVSFRMSSIGNMKPEEQKNEINQYRNKLLAQYTTKESFIQARDFQLLGEGLAFLHHRLPNVQSFIQGIEGR